MVELVKYTPDKEQETAKRVIDFFGFHDRLMAAGTDYSETRYKETLETIQEWQAKDNVLYVIVFDHVSVGFLRIQYRGSIVAWIEDIYVDSEYRGMGIATEAIRLAEDIVKSKPGYVAVCFDVVPRNTDAIHLYHKLGYTDVSILTLRKEFGESKRDRPLSMFGKDFKY